MVNGYVYVLLNYSMQNLVKIGKTTRSSADRAREISSSTGVPTPFIVAFEVFSEDCDGLEMRAHAHFAASRVANNREFFSAPLKDVIEYLLSNNEPARDPNSVFAAEDILPGLQMRFLSQLDPTVVGARIVQSSSTVWLETTREELVAGNLHDSTIRRTDLGFIMHGDLPTFSASNTLAANIGMFMALNDYSIVMCTDLLHEDACRAICDREELT